MIWLAETHPDALRDYSNPEDYVNQRSDPFRPFEEDDPVGDRVITMELIIQATMVVKYPEKMIWKQNTGTPHPDNNTLGEGDMNTGDNGASSCPDDSTQQSSTLAQRNQRNSEATTVSREVHAHTFQYLWSVNYIKRSFIPWI